MQLLILAAVFVATVCLTVGAYLFANRRRLSAAELARERLAEVEGLRPSHGTPTILKSEGGAGLALLNRLVAGKSFTSWLTSELKKTGTDLPASAFVWFTIGSAAAGILLGGVLRNPGVAIAGVLIGAILPSLWMNWKKGRRLRAFEGQLPESIDMLVSAMKAGYSFQAAMNFIGQEVAAPLGPEFARFYDEQRLGVDVRSALIGLQERVDSMDLKMFVTAVLVQRESGGNLAEVLANISDIMRERFAMEGEIETLTAEAKLSARILTALPVVVFLAIFMINPSFMQPMLTQPSGKTMLVVSAVSVVLGYFAMMKIARIDI